MWSPAACLSPRRGEVSRSDGEGPPVNVAEQAVLARPSKAFPAHGEGGIRRSPALKDYLRVARRMTDEAPVSAVGATFGRLPCLPLRGRWFRAARSPEPEGVSS